MGSAFYKLVSDIFDSDDDCCEEAHLRFHVGPTMVCGNRAVPQFYMTDRPKLPSDTHSVCSGGDFQAIMVCETMEDLPATLLQNWRNASEVWFTAGGPKEIDRVVALESLIRKLESLSVYVNDMAFRVLNSFEEFEKRSGSIVVPLDVGAVLDVGSSTVHCCRLQHDPDCTSPTILRYHSFRVGAGTDEPEGVHRTRMTLIGQSAATLAMEANDAGLPKVLAGGCLSMIPNWPEHDDATQFAEMNLSTMAAWAKERLGNRGENASLILNAMLDTYNSV